MTGYTKLHASILASTIWGEDNHVRILWITLLAMADRHGEVNASIPGLSQMARLTIEEVQDGLKCLMAPDPYSRTKTDDGRRVREIEGGWFLINYPDYRDKFSADERRAYKAAKQREYRARGNRKCPRVDTKSTTGQSGYIAEAEAEAVPPAVPKGDDNDSHDSKNPKEPETTKGSSPKELKQQLESIYEAYPRKVGKPAALRAIEKAIKERGAVFVLDATERYAAKVEEWPQADRCFVPHPATWFNQQRFNDDPATWERNGNGGNHGLPPGQRLKLLQDERAEVSDDLRHERDMKKRTEGLRRLSEIDKQIKELAEL